MFWKIWWSYINLNSCKELNLFILKRINMLFIFMNYFWISVSDIKDDTLKAISQVKKMISIVQTLELAKTETWCIHDNPYTIQLYEFIFIYLQYWKHVFIMCNETVIFVKIYLIIFTMIMEQLTVISD